MHRRSDGGGGGSGGIGGGIGNLDGDVKGDGFAEGRRHTIDRDVVVGGGSLDGTVTKMPSLEIFFLELFDLPKTFFKYDVAPHFDTLV